MSGSDIPSQAVRDLLSLFGRLRPQLPSDWAGEVRLHPSLARFYAEVGPYGEDGPHGPDGLTIPTTGNPFGIAPLARLWEEAGEGIYSGGFEVRPEWQAVLRTRLAPVLGTSTADTVASRLGW